MRKYKPRTTLVCTGLWLHRVTDFVQPVQIPISSKASNEVHNKQEARI